MWKGSKLCANVCISRIQIVAEECCAHHHLSLLDLGPASADKRDSTGNSRTGLVRHGAPQSAKGSGHTQRAGCAPRPSPIVHFKDVMAPPNLENFRISKGVWKINAEDIEDMTSRAKSGLKKSFRSPSRDRQLELQ